MKRTAWMLALAITACGPSSMVGDGSGGGGGGTDGGSGGGGGGGGGPVGTIQGVVWAPGMAPGMVPAGQEIPIYNALVYVSVSKPDPIPQETYCEQCVDPGGSHVFSEHDGSFSLGNIVPGDYWLVIQKGQFRLDQQVTVTANQVLQLSDAQSTLPSVQDPANGKWIPKIAVAVGAYDDLQDILGKMGIGSVNGSGGFVAGSQPAQLDIWDNDSWSFSGTTKGTLDQLVGNLNTMLQYHMILIPCSTATYTAALQNQANLRNIRDYVAAGGKLYVTDWSGEWSDNVFPIEVTLEDSTTDTPASAYNASTDSWNTSQFGDADGSYYDSQNAEAADDDLKQWLNGQMGPTASGGLSVIDASNFEVSDNWNTITDLTQVQIGMDDEGLPIYDTPKAWVIGGHNTSTPKNPLTVTFEPTGCGRVLYSTYHTTASQHLGLVPQERVLLYLMMEIGVCYDGPPVVN